MYILKRSKKHISWIVPSSSKNPDRQLASVWIRSLQMIPYLENMGIKCALNKTFPVPEVAIFLRRYMGSDVLLARKIKNKGTRIVLDVVANYFEVYAPNLHGYGGCTKDQNYNFMQLAELADEIWCVSPFLKSLAERYHQNVFFISDSINKQHFSFNKSYETVNTKHLRIGWSGVSLKASPLEILKPWVLKNNLSLCVITDRQPSLSFPYEFRKWSYNKFPMDIIDCDLCVAPRDVDDNYNRGHSIFKIGVFMSEGVPVLAGPVPSYDLLLGDGRGGYICRSSKEWNINIDKCLNDENILKKWSDEAKERVQPFLTHNVAKQIALRIESLMSEI